ncbi:MAG: F0F1 ATP synthase subunit B [Candidatus Saccharimonadales bacterium]
MIALLPTILASAEAAAEPQGIAALGIDPWAILAQAVTFLLLFVLIKKFALSKIVNTLEARRKTIDKGVLLGIEMEQQKEHLDEEVDKMLQKARAEADKIIAGGQTEAGAIIKQAEADAGRKADALMADAHNRIGEDIERAKNELKKDMINLVANATGAIIHEKVTAQSDGKLIAKILEEAK